MSEIVVGILIGVVGDETFKTIYRAVVRLLKDVIHFHENRNAVTRDIERASCLLEDIFQVYEEQQRRPMPHQQTWLDDAKRLIDKARRLVEVDRGGQCHLCGLLRRPIMSVKMKRMRKKIDLFLQSPEIDTSCSVQDRAALLQPYPYYGFVGMQITSQLHELMEAQEPEARVIGVHGMPGVGKTLLLKDVYNSYKQNNFFEVVIWVTVSRSYDIPNLQGQIAEAINLNLSVISTDNRKMMLFASLKSKRFLLILDDMWTPLDLQQELGVGFGKNRGSKVVFSTRNRDLTLMEGQRSVKMEPWSKEKGWELFHKVAFQQSHVSEELEKCAKTIAAKCEGLPLAITVVAASMSGKTTLEEWNDSLSLMRIPDPSFRDIHPRLHKELYLPLKRSYDDLSNSSLQNCFLYCAMFPEDVKIDVDILVKMWIAEGLVKSKEATYSLDMVIGRSYVQHLIDRGLFVDKPLVGNVKKPENVWKPKYVRVHRVIRDLALYIGENENYLLWAGHQVKGFPHAQARDCSRISLHQNQIEDLPKDFIGSKVVSLILSKNPLTCHVLDSFLVSLTSLRVLDLCNTHIVSVPTSLSQLTCLEFLSLSRTPICDFPAAICNLSRLHFLDLSFCCHITSLPHNIGNFIQLQDLNLWGSHNLVIPPEISQLTSLKRLQLHSESTEPLKDLTLLTELALTIISRNEETEITMNLGTLLEMRHLSLNYIDAHLQQDLPRGMQNMCKLVTLRLINYKGVNLPDWLCEFQRLERLELIGCDRIRELPPLETLPKLKFLKLKECTQVTAFRETSNGFPALERLDFVSMPNLQSMVMSLPTLRILKIRSSPLLRVPTALAGVIDWGMQLVGHWDDDGDKSTPPKHDLRWDSNGLVGFIYVVTQ